LRLGQNERITAPHSEAIRQTVDLLFREEGRRVLATLIRLLGDFDIAEDAMHEAFRAALERWPAEGVPANPRAWLITAGRFRGIDSIRKQVRRDASMAEIAKRLEAEPEEDWIDEEIGDDRLRLIFTCCHPALPPDARIALTLREVCGLTTEEIANAFLSSPPTIAQRIVRAKAKIRDEGIPYQVPSREELAERLDTVLHVVYLVFNEGYSASSGETLVRSDLSAEAIRLGRLIFELLPEPEVGGLLALMLLQESRRIARTSASGDVVLLEDQDRSTWDHDLIREGVELVGRSLGSRRFGPFTLQAAIAAVHAESLSAAQTDWAQIVALYGLLLQVEPSPVVELNRAVAVAMSEGPEAGIQLIEAILRRGELEQYQPAHAALGELCRRAGRVADARHSLERALALTRPEPQRRLLEMRLAELG